MIFLSIFNFIHFTNKLCGQHEKKTVQKGGNHKMMPLLRWRPTECNKTSSTSLAQLKEKLLELKLDAVFKFDNWLLQRYFEVAHSVYDR